MGENHYELSSEEEEYLDANYSSSWEYLPPEGEGGVSGLVICKFSVPSGYTPEKSDMMIIIPQGYPGAVLDMFYFCPELKKINSNAINALAPVGHFGREWQRWSRHYSWTPGCDSIISHIEFVKNTLQNEASQ